MKWGSKFGPRLGTVKRGKHKQFWDLIFDPFFGENCLERPPRAAKSDSKITFFGSKRVQERFKRPPRGFLRASASTMRCGPHFGPTCCSPKRIGDLKNQGRLMEGRRFLRFRDFRLEPLSDLDFGPSWPPFWELSGPQDG